MRFTDDRLFDYPWVYATQTGWWNLSDAETARLREYLLRGGFLVVDDFWGADQWEIFRETMARVLPGHADSGSGRNRFSDACSLRYPGQGPHLHSWNAAFAARAGRDGAGVSAAKAPRRPGARCMTTGATWWWR